MPGKCLEIGHQGNLSSLARGTSCLDAGKPMLESVNSKAEAKRTGQTDGPATSSANGYHGDIAELRTIMKIQFGVLCFLAFTFLAAYSLPTGSWVNAMGAYLFLVITLIVSAPLVYAQARHRLLCFMEIKPDNR